MMMKTVLDWPDRYLSILGSVSASRLIEEGEHVKGITDIRSSPVRVNDLVEDIRDSSLEACGSSSGGLGFGIECRDVVSGE